jgi:hypothetical protein
MQVPLMNSSEASDILRAYALVLRRVPLFTTALPQSLLPHDKDAIKRAIKMMMSLVGQDEFTVSTLKHAYRSLAFFVPDEEAAVVSRAQNSQTSRTVDHTEPGLIARMMRIRQEICQNQQTLVEEFRGLCETT